MKKTRTSLGSRNAATREDLISAAIKVLANVGYAGATMRSIADEAGVTQGPRQYYFPTPALLFEAVVDKIQGASSAHVEKMRRAVESGSLEEKVRAIAEPAFKNCGSDHQLAMIELKLACRGDGALRSAIEAKIQDFEDRQDRIWIDLLKESGIPDDELKYIRSIVGATLRGLGVAIAAGSPRRERIQSGETLIQLIMKRIEAV